MANATRLRWCVCLLVLLVCPSAASAARIVVTTTVDEVVVNGNCSLREAILAANTDSIVDRCRGAGADTILLPAGIFQLDQVGPNDDAGYTGDLDILSEIAIRGTGAGHTIISGTPLPGTSEDWLVADRVVHVSQQGRLTLVGLTVRKGNCGHGAGILNGGYLFVSDSSVHDNYAGYEFDNCLGGSDWDFGGAGIYNESQGTLVVLRSSVSNRSGLDVIGGGVVNHGNALIEKSLFGGNASAAGGAVYNLGEMEIVDSQFFSNFGRFYGGAILNSGTATVRRTTISNNFTAGSGGTIDNHALLILENSTISGNLGYSTLRSRPGGTLIVRSSTVANNDSLDLGAIRGGGHITLFNTIVVNPGRNCEGTIVSLGNNLDSDDTCGLTTYTDLPNTDPLIGPLSDNGGWSPTHALLPGSPARDRIAPADCSATDQRSISRPYPRKGLCDIGSYEFSPSGEILLLIEDLTTMGHGGHVTRELEFALIHLLKPAMIAAGSGNSPGACVAMGDFISAVSAYSANGALSPADAEMLRVDADRIRVLVCG